ncbi:hypothetical protein diail_11258 [Diaporthe ilicicola]|nr:hypothetical protein diail_11258 [Diaporthe ilicicola]
MSSNHDMPTASGNGEKEGNSSFKGLGASRWASDGNEDQRIAEDEALTTLPKGLPSPRWATEEEKNSTITKAKFTTTKNNFPTTKHKHSSMLYNDEKSPMNENTNPGHRIIGPLTAEEKTVRMENPCLDPTKDKGLGDPVKKSSLFIHMQAQDGEISYSRQEMKLA